LEGEILDLYLIIMNTFDRYQIKKKQFFCHG